MNSEGVHRTRVVHGEGMSERATPEVHPAPEDVFDYQRGHLSPEEDDAIRDHLAECAECTDKVLELAGLRPSPFLETPPERSAEHWHASGSIPASSLPPWRRTLDRVALPLAAGLTLFALAAVYWSLQNSRQSELARQEPTVNVVLHELQPDGAEGSLRENTPSASPDVQSGSEILVLNLADARGFYRFRAEVRSASDPQRLLWASDALERSAVGRFTVLLPAKFLQPGRYWCRLLGLSDRPPELVAEYGFEIGEVP